VAAFHKLQITEQKMLKGDKSIIETWKRYDSEFHHALISACQSANLLALHAVLFDKYLRYQMSVLTNRGNEAVKEHKGMFDAALKRDVPKAQKLLNQHITRGLKHAIKALRD